MLVRRHCHRKLPCVRHRHALGRHSSLDSLEHPHRTLPGIGTVHLLDNEEIGKRYGIRKYINKKSGLTVAFFIVES